MKTRHDDCIKAVPIRRSFGGWLGSILLAAGLLGSGAQAAEFHAVEMPDGSGHAIILSGVIEPGDEIVFHKLADCMGNATVLTTGPGGRVKPALLIGSEIRARGWSTLVPAGGWCASACSMIWLAGQVRMLGTGAQIGFHAMSMIRNGQRTETHEADMDLRKWLTALGYTLDATATIVNTEASSIRWYNIIELRANGIPAGFYP